ncbi:hypothetical protein OG257_32810 [Streptomyces sp. NBC_00683]|uniref:hypothetical protein n=1 Tax=Streptomyces sp. NBC_00683 TaxID=2903670 RepID=UPI002E31D41E|nr:hypothetical protein [Streptomyces sp. NBC_00683]
MPNSPAVPGSVRPAAVVNEEIRDLRTRSDGTLTPEGQREYEQLLVEWAVASRTDAEAA